MSELIPCKHLDHDIESYPSCELKTCAPHFPDVKYWQRNARIAGEGNPLNVQFCGQGRGRINSIFDCYDGSLSCYAPTELVK